MCAVRAYDVRASGVRRAACVRRTNPTLSDVDVSHAHARAHKNNPARVLARHAPVALASPDDARPSGGVPRRRRDGRRAGGMYPGGYIRRS